MSYYMTRPRSVGATPLQVFIDGIPHLRNPASTAKPDAFQYLPRTPFREKEVRQTIEYETN
jgi:hypothetical protein